MERRASRSRKEDSFGMSNPTAITTSRITTRARSINANDNNATGGSPSTEKSAKRASTRNRGRLTTNVVVPPTVVESPVKLIEVQKKSVTSVKTPTKNSPRTRIIPITMENTNDAARNSPSRQSDLSTATTRTINLNSEPTNNETESVVENIRRSASKTLFTVADTLRRSLSRQRSTTPSVTATESRYSRASTPYEDEEEYSDNEYDANAYISTNSEPYLSPMEQEFLCRPKQIPREFFGPWGIAILVISVPLLVSYLVANTFKPHGLTVEELVSKLKPYETLPKHIFPLEVVNVYLLFQLGMFVLSGALFGRVVYLKHTIKFNFNALTIAVLLNLAWLIKVAGNYYPQVNVVNFVLKNQWRFYIYGVLYAYINGTFAYIKALWKPTHAAQLNAYGQTNNWLVDMALGRELNPHWLNSVNLKLYFYRTQLIISLLIGECYLIKSLSPLIKEAASTSDWQEFVLHTMWQKIDWNSATMIAAAMLILYVLDQIIFEHHLAASFELQGEGFGILLLLRYAVTPYLITGIVRCCHLLKTTNNGEYMIYLAMFGLLVGLMLKRISSAIKYKYRLNPTHCYFDNIDTIHTFQGRRLLVDPCWGRLRQPNYAGDMLALLSISIAYMLSSTWQAHMGLMLIIILLLHRCTRVNKRNYQRYHSSWVRYCQMVPYYILPKVY